MTLPKNISAIVLAAGLSRRMGKPKLLLPWGDTTVIGTVVMNLIQSGLDDIIVVTGGTANSIESVLQKYTVRTVFNRNYEIDNMMLSLKVGFEAVSHEQEAVLIVLGDQPQIGPDIIASILTEFYFKHSKLIIPSYHKKRGHPWLIKKELWSELCNLEESLSMRDFLQTHKSDISYIEMDDPSILRDLDTPGDYESQRP